MSRPGPITKLLVLLFLGAPLFGWARQDVKKSSSLPLGIPAFDLSVFRRDEIALGEKLFFDPRLSKNGRISCATCHEPSRSFSSGQRVVTGVEGIAGNRNSPALINRHFSTAQMWDGRIPSLRDQVTVPIESELEMHQSLENAVTFLNRNSSLKRQFERVYQAPPDVELLKSALAAFVGSIFSGNSRYDRFQAGDKNALSPLEKTGRELFENKFKCVSCHSGFNFTNEKVMESCASKEPADGPYQHKYKVPTLRNLALTAPYFHNGRLETLEEVLDFYEGCARVDKDGKPETGSSPLVILPEEKKALISFLRSLDGEVVSVSPER
jgi:cytochrome c peroxidase